MVTKSTTPLTKITVPFGRHKGLTPEQILDLDPSYFNWLYTEGNIYGSLRDEFKRLAEENQDYLDEVLNGD